jgi:hypothetical protein
VSHVSPCVVMIERDALSVVTLLMSKRVPHLLFINDAKLSVACTRASALLTCVTACSAYEILFSDANTGAQVADGATRLLDAEWHTWTCTLGKLRGCW